MDYEEAYNEYAARGIPRMDAEIAKKSHFWMETNYRPGGRQCFKACSRDKNLLSAG